MSFLKILSRPLCPCHSTRPATINLYRASPQKENYGRNKRYGELLYNEVLGITDYFLNPKKGKIYIKKKHLDITKPCYSENRGSTVITPNDDVHNSPVNLSLTADTMANAFAEIIIQNYESGSLHVNV